MAKFQQNSLRTFSPRIAHNSLFMACNWEVGNVAGDSSGPEKNVTQVPQIQGKFRPGRREQHPFLLVTSQNESELSFSLVISIYLQQRIPGSEDQGMEISHSHTAQARRVYSHLHPVATDKGQNGR